MAVLQWPVVVQLQLGAHISVLREIVVNINADIREPAFKTNVSLRLDEETMERVTPQGWTYSRQGTVQYLPPSLQASE